MYVCVCVCVSMYIYPLNQKSSKEKKKKHDFEQVYTLYANKKPTHILKNKKKKTLHIKLPQGSEFHVGKIEAFIGKFLITEI